MLATVRNFEEGSSRSTLGSLKLRVSHCHSRMVTRLAKLSSMTSGDRMREGSILSRDFPHGPQQAVG